MDIFYAIRLLSRNSHLFYNANSYVWDFQLNYVTDEAPDFRRHRWVEEMESKDQI